MWRWCLNSKQAALQLIVEGLRRCEMGQGEAPKEKEFKEKGTEEKQRKRKA